MSKRVFPLLPRRAPGPCQCCGIQPLLQAEQSFQDLHQPLQDRLHPTLQPQHLLSQNVQASLENTLVLRTQDKRASNNITMVTSSILLGLKKLFSYNTSPKGHLMQKASRKKLGVFSEAK